MINISVVLYNTSKNDIRRIIKTLQGYKHLNKLYLIDNSPYENIELKKLKKNKIRYIFNAKNLGYGKAHNIAIEDSILNKVEYHLVLNPDVYFSNKILDEIKDFMDKNNDIGQLLPKTLYPNNEIQYNYRMLPTPFILFSRAFLPEFFYKTINDKYELKNFNNNKLVYAPSLSGCFMFMRVSVLKKIGIFDERFFMYLEDVDLSRRIHLNSKTVYYPFVSITHRHEKASYNNLKMKIIHIINAIKYFNKYGWFFDSERKRVNKNFIK